MLIQNEESILKKYLFVVLLLCLTSNLFADGKKELKKIVENVNSKEFLNANEHIDKLQEQGQQYVSQGKYEKALECYKKALAESEKLFGRNSTATASSYTAMAVPYIKIGKNLKAADSLVKASEIFNKSAGKLVRPRAARLLLMRAGFIYYDANSYKQAWETLKKAEKDIAKFTPDEKRTYMPRFYRYLALAFFRDNKFEKAIPYLKKSLSVESQKKSQNNIELGMINLFLGNALINIDKFEDALVYLQNAEKYFKSPKTAPNYKYKLFFSFSIACKYLKKKEKHLYYAKKLNEASSNLAQNDYRRVMAKVILADSMNAINNKTSALKVMQEALTLAKKQKISPQRFKRLNGIFKDIKKSNKIKN